MASSQVIEAIAVTAELCGRTFTPAAAAVFASDLDGFTDAQVIAALTRCRKEVRGFLNIADVVSRIDDGRPGAEQAWAMIPQDEETSVVWSEEMAAAFGIAAPLLQMGDKIGARMAFKESYAKMVSDARDQKQPPKWTPSFGQDVIGRQGAVIEAVRLNRLTLDHGLSLLPHEAQQGLLLSLNVEKHPLLAAPASKENRQRLAAMLLTLNPPRIEP